MTLLHQGPVSARAGVWLVLAAALIFALPAAAARVVDVRVGAHPDFTRVVLELDRAAGYRVERSGDPESPEITVTLDAAAETQRLPSRGDIRGVRVEGGENAVAHIELRRPGLRLQEMILANPPRIVLDVMREKPAAAPEPAQPPRESGRAAPPPPEPEPQPAPVDEEAAPTSPEPPPEPEARPALVPAPEPEWEVEEEPAPDRAEPERPAPAPPPEPEPEPEAAAESAAERVEDEGAESAAPPPAREAEPAPARPPLPRSRAAQPPPEPQSPGLAHEEPGLVERLTSQPALLAALAGALLVLVAAAFVIARRRRRLPADLDVSEPDAADDSRVPAGGFAMEPSAQGAEVGAPLSSLFDEPTSPSSDLGLEEGGAAASQGDDAMSQDFDLPATRSGAPSAPPAAAAGPGGDLIRLMQELERRVAGLESKLEEANEAREKLERQVAAQGEELRVQRAAIARTQRALRTMTRADEDKATEPALREGDPQAATRIKA